MAIQILRDLRGLRVQIIHPPDAEGVSLIEHLRRIGCTVEAQWPIPEAFSDAVDVVLLSIDHDCRDQIVKLLRGQNDSGSWYRVDGDAEARMVGANYTTAMAVLALTVEYRFLPIYQRGEEPTDDRKDKQ